MVLEGKADLQLPPVLAFVLPIIFWERFDVNGMRSETITVSTCTQRPHRTWSGARTGTRSGSFGFFDCMAEAGTATRGTQPPCGCSTAAGASQAGGRRGRRAGGHRKGDTASLRAAERR